MRGSVTVPMAAPPDRIWSLVSDVTRIGELSPETFEAEWLDGATGPEEGARFRGHVRRNGRGPVYWTKCRVTASQPGRVFEFAVEGPGGKAMNTWRYEISATDGGADVTESFALTPTMPMRAYWALAGSMRGRANERGMRATLERVKKLVEADAED